MKDIITEQLRKEIISNRALKKMDDFVEAMMMMEEDEFEILLSRYAYLSKENMKDIEELFESVKKRIVKDYGEDSGI